MTDESPRERPTSPPDSLEAVRYDDGSIGYPGHPLGPNGAEPVETVDLSEYTAEIVTWTTSTATPPGVREPNTLAIVEFDVDGDSVRAIGQVTTDDVEIGERVRPVYAEQLRDPNAAIRAAASQRWDGFRFEPVEN
ncbi:OB-fold domain-containing protein [Halovivax gelatinilyticus]|uniref:OB-fold domain-containing protein n=1 Tax=Halovivax gelatinilyticus TaxID=2961597 RepID=UPI0020CA7EB5|nr:OB-fold domain-containing protein [Halovivax gelatinilyticus]